MGDKTSIATNRRIRNTNISIRIPMDVLDAIERQVSENNFPTFSKAIRYYIELGMLSDSLKDKVKTQEFIDETNKLKKLDTASDWMQDLNENQLGVLVYMIHDEKSKRVQKIIDIVKKS